MSAIAIIDFGSRTISVVNISYLRVRVAFLKDILSILGSVDKILEKPYKSSNKIEKTHKNLSSFIKSGKNAP
ncbi:MAG: hypothetical protein O7198_03415, partial [Wolbachia endosymbiont of Nomada marshamella]|nr:hypothetical protein [Wolbachia endosymbiont of Nomada marshamella]